MVGGIAPLVLLAQAVAIGNQRRLQAHLHVAVTRFAAIELGQQFDRALPVCAVIGPNTH